MQILNFDNMGLHIRNVYVREFLAELLGTMILIFFGDGVVAQVRSKVKGHFYQRSLLCDHVPKTFDLSVKYMLCQRIGRIFVDFGMCAPLSP